jgi:organic radical activating enzyme
MTVYCTAPWNGITVREDGHVRTCCVGSVSLGNLNQTPINEILESPALARIKQNMLSGKPDIQNCMGCIRSQNSAGLAGVRQHYNMFYPDANQGKFELKNLDIRWNNVCNLGCMYCNSTFSSTWQNRDGTNKGTVVKDYQDNLLDWILQRSDQLQEVMLVGGEPMLMKQNYALIDQLPDQCRISIITNLSYDLPNLPCIKQLQGRPKDQTLWNVSLENTSLQFEYVRSGSKWEDVEHNLLYLMTHWPDQVSINFVYSMFSAFNIVETIQTLHRIGIKKINLFPIYDNPTMDVFNMPDSIRLEAANNLSQAIDWHRDNLCPEDIPLYPIQGGDAMLAQLKSKNTSSTITLDAFLTKVEWYDQYHENKFNNLWPNVVDLVRKHL